MEAKFLRMMNAWREERSVNQIKSQLYDIFATLEEQAQGNDYDVDFLKCIEIMKERYCDSDFSIESICRQMHISRSGIQRRFQKHFSIGPKRYLMKLRMNKALDVMSEGELSVKKVAFLCGFDDEKYFSRSFKRTFGCPPAEFIKKRF